MRKFAVAAVAGAAVAIAGGVVLPRVLQPSHPAAAAEAPAAEPAK